MKDNFLSLLAVMFIGLKLAGYIAWSWIWVLSPIWIPFLTGAIILAATFTYKSYSERNQ